MQRDRYRWRERERDKEREYFVRKSGGAWRERTEGEE